MNPSPTEEAGQTARTFIDAMKARPDTLAILAINVLWVVAVFWLAHNNNAREDQLLSDLVKACTVLGK
jgi:hypothetical protein